jgi:uncharacterized protein YcbK (DUF882 family)
MPQPLGLKFFFSVKRYLKRMGVIGLALSPFVFVSFVLAQDNPIPFFLMGNGKIHLKNIKTGQEARVDLLNPDGSLNEKSLSAVDRVFGFPTLEMGDHISPRLLFMLDYFSDLTAQEKPILLHSGYRNPEYNQKLKSAGGNVAKTSTHIDGLAVDFSIAGVKGKDLWELIRQKNCCGVGHYGGEVVHLDSARPRFWEAATSKVTTGESDYNRRIYLSTEYDRYRPGKRVRLFFNSVSEFGFGIRRKALIGQEVEGNFKTQELEIAGPNRSECILIPDRKASRFIYLTLPENLDPGNYRIQLDFCQRPFEQMPAQTISNPIEIVNP